MAKMKSSISYMEPLKSMESKTVVGGVVSVDITPPPGMPTAGYSIFSKSCYGVRTKLKARVIYLKPSVGSPVAIVQCDLLSGSLLVHHLVSEIISKETDVDSSALAICGTHTHSGPGNYYENAMYNDKASNKKGLEPNYLEFCSKQIAKAVIKAYNQRQEVRIATGDTEIWGVTINRSYPPYLQNENIKGIKGSLNELKAINPTLSMIRIDGKDSLGKFSPIGIITTFSIHPNTNPAEIGMLYSGDITGFVERMVENQIMDRYSTEKLPVYAALNHAHGDCNANHIQTRVENFKDQQNIAKEISQHVMGLFESLDDKLKGGDITIGYRTEEIDLLKNKTVENISIDKRGFAGMSVPGGTNGRGRSTPFRKLPFFKEGRPRKIFTKGAQGVKHIAGGRLLQRAIIPAKVVPHEIIFQIIQIDDTLLIPLPWEVTQESGFRIEMAAQSIIKSRKKSKIKRSIVVNTSNGYAGYLTTREEYSLQFYEGGSNYYGPNTTGYISRQIAKVTENYINNGSGGRMFKTFRVNLPLRRYYPKMQLSTGKRQIEGEPEFHKKADFEESYWSIRWMDVAPSLINFHEPLIKIEVQEDNGKWKQLKIDFEIINDDGCQIAIIDLRKNIKDGMSIYESRWYNQIDDGRFFRFAVLERGDRDILYSQPFGKND